MQGNPPARQDIDDEPGLAQLLDPAALEARLAEARSRRAQAIARRALEKDGRAGAQATPAGRAQGPPVARPLAGSAVPPAPGGLSDLTLRRAFRNMRDRASGGQDEVAELPARESGSVDEAGRSPRSILLFALGMVLLIGFAAGVLGGMALLLTPRSPTATAPPADLTTVESGIEAPPAPAAEVPARVPDPPPAVTLAATPAGEWKAELPRVAAGLPVFEQPLMPGEPARGAERLSPTSFEDALSPPEPPIDWNRAFPPPEAVPDAAEGTDARPLLTFSTPAIEGELVAVREGRALRFAWDASAPAAWSWDVVPERAEPSAPAAARTAAKPAQAAVSRRSDRATPARVPAAAPQSTPAGARPAAPTKPSVSQGEVEDMLRNRLLGR